MTAPTSTQIIAALADEALKDRFKAVAPLCGWTGAEVEAAWERIVVTAVDETGDATVSGVHAYAKNLYDQALAAVPAAPGADTTKVTDDHICHVLTALKAPTPAA
jgi:hypothetical protein